MPLELLESGEKVGTHTIKKQIECDCQGQIQGNHSNDLYNSQRGQLLLRNFTSKIPQGVILSQDQYVLGLNFSAFLESSAKISDFHLKK